MNDLEKAALNEEAANQTPAPAETENICAETESPATQIEAVADAAADETTQTAEEAPAPEAPEADPRSEAVKRIHSLDKAQLLEELKSILERDDMEAHKEVAAIKQAFFNIRSRESLDQLNAWVAEGKDPAAFAAEPDETEATVKELYSQFKDRRAAHLEAEVKRREENLARKREILDKMKAIASDIDTVNTRFSEFQQLQQDFKAIKDVPPTAETEIWKEFQTVGEEFYDHLKMNKELRDLDFRKNLEAKKQLIEQAVKLQQTADPVAAFRALQGLHDEWRSIGPVAKELRESIWDEFKEASAVVNRRHQEYFEQRKAAEQANEEAKTKLCEEVEAIDTDAIKSFAGWSDATDKVIEIQKKWKEYGFASKKANALLYTRFRKACDTFFDAKTAFFQKSRDEFNENLARKTALCEKAEALKDSKDINRAAAEVVKLQAEWKTIGSVPRKQSDTIWQRFTTACNFFFDERKKQNKERKNKENEALEKKRAIIAALKELPLDGDRREVIGRTKELQSEWQEAGFVPFRLKDQIFAEYRAVCDAIYGAYAEREKTDRMGRFQNRVNKLKGEGQGKVTSERDKLVRALENRINELQTVENNMGFFKVKSNEGNSIVKDMERSIERLKADIKEIKEKIALIDAQEK